MPSQIWEFKIETLVVAGSLAAISGLSWILSAQPIAMKAMIQPSYQFELIPMLLFTASWTLGMIAMMFPTVIPMTLMLFRAGRSATHETKAGGGPTLAKALVFAGAYVALWAGFGATLYLAISAVSALAVTFGQPSQYFVLVPGVIVLGSGIYQFLPLKSVCLNRCHPSSFLFRNFRSGLAGSARMGVSYGVFCIGCCWVLMANLLLIGAMNLTWMSLFAVAILLERISPEKWQVAKILGGLLLISGIILILGVLR